LPILRVHSFQTCQYTWHTEMYKTIHKWQIARGFDPTTTDFGCYCGNPVFEVVYSESS
ncbi:hypothetical protein L218DRAFT_833890, partial [Marasmius fiardii PR-910]